MNRTSGKKDNRPEKFKIKVFGDDLAEIFLKAASEMNIEQAKKEDKELKSFLSGQWEEIHLEEKNRDELLANWLKKILALSKNGQKNYFNFSLLNFSETGLSAKISGQKNLLQNQTSHKLKLEEAKIKETGGKWEAEITLGQE